MINQLYVLSKLFPDDINRGYYFYNNPNITIELFLEQHKQIYAWHTPRINFDLWYGASENKNLTKEILEKYIDHPWVWSTISERDIIDLDFIERNPHNNWKIEDVSCNPNITLEVVKNNRHIPWHFDKVLKHIDINITDMKECCELARQYISRDTYYEALSRNPTITWKFIEENIEEWEEELFDEWSNISSKACVTCEIIEKYPNIPWNWKCISDNPNITIKFIIDHLNEEWDWHKISIHTNITPDIVNSYPDLPWDWFEMSYNPNITFEFIKEHLDKKWYWNQLTSLPIITWQIIQENKDLLWNYCMLSSNPNITAKLVVDNPDIPWNFSQFARNKFGKHPVVRERTLREKYTKLWRDNVRKRVAYRKHLFDPVMDMLRLRIRDYHNNVRTKLT